MKYEMAYIKQSYGIFTWNKPESTFKWLEDVDIIGSVVEIIENTGISLDDINTECGDVSSDDGDANTSIVGLLLLVVVMSSLSE